MAKQKSLMRGMLAGMAGGLVAAWMMNEFVLGPGQKIEKPLEVEETGPLAHYAFGVLSGGIYGGLAEYSGTSPFRIWHQLRWRPVQHRRPRVGDSTFGNGSAISPRPSPRMWSTALPLSWCAVSCAPSFSNRLD